MDNSDFEIIGGELRRYNGESSDVVIPDGVIAISPNAFTYNRGTLETVTIPGSVKSIGKMAFATCFLLTSVTIPESVTSLDYGVFAHCESLTNITVSPLNKTYKSIDGNIYSYDGTELVQYAVGKTDETFNIPEGVTSIGGSAFVGCEAIKNIIIPNGVKSIGRRAFSECKSVKNIILPDSITTIGEGAFSGTAIESITLPGSVTSLGCGAFDCDSLTNISVSPDNKTYKSIDGNLYSYDGKELVQYAIGKTDKKFKIPDGVTAIGRHSFRSCKSVEDITIPDSVTAIGENAFSWCHSLFSIVIPDGVTTIEESTFGWCYSLYRVTLPDSVTTIGDTAFSGCKLLGWINGAYPATLPSSLTTIGKFAFSGTGFDYITIPGSVISVGEGVFSGCKQLKEIHCYTKKPLFSSLPKGWDRKWLGRGDDCLAKVTWK